MMVVRFLSTSPPPHRLPIPLPELLNAYPPTPILIERAEQRVDVPLACGHVQGAEEGGELGAVKAARGVGIDGGEEGGEGGG